MTEPSRAVRIRPTQIASRRAGDEVVVLDLAGAVYHALNGSGALLWERMEGGATVEELAEALVTSYGLTAEEAAGDIDRFLGECADAGLILISPP